MRLELTGRHFTMTAAIRRLVEQRLSQILRMLNDSAVSAKVVLTKENARYHAEVTLHARGEHFLHGESTGRDAAVATSVAADKIDRQVEKLRGKWNERKRRASPATKAGRLPGPRPRDGHTGGTRSNVRERGADEDRELRIIRARQYAVKPMSVDDAALEITDGPETFLVFRNAMTDAINVLFRRRDGNLGLIEPEA